MISKNNETYILSIKYYIKSIPPCRISLCFCINAWTRKISSLKSNAFIKLRFKICLLKLIARSKKSMTNNKNKKRPESKNQNLNITTNL